MVTKEEFEEMWNENIDSVKEIKLMSGDVVSADGFHIVSESVELTGGDWIIGRFLLNNIRTIEND